MNKTHKSFQGFQNKSNISFSRKWKNILFMISFTQMILTKKNLKTKSYEIDQNIVDVGDMAFTFHFYTSKQIFIKKIPFSQTFYIISLWKTVAFILADVHTNNHITCLRKLPNLLLFVPRRIHKQHILPSRLALISCTQKHAQNFKFNSFQWRNRSDKVFIWYWNCFLISILFNISLFHIKS